MASPLSGSQRHCQSRLIDIEDDQTTITHVIPQSRVIRLIHSCSRTSCSAPRMTPPRAWCRPRRRLSPPVCRYVLQTRARPATLQEFVAAAEPPLAKAATDYTRRVLNRISAIDSGSESEDDDDDAVF